MQRRRLLAVLGVAWSTGCSTPAPAPPALLLRLPPAMLGRRLALAQQLRIWAGDREAQFEALLEADESMLRLAMLAFGRPVARLEWDGHALTQHAAPGWPPAITAEHVLSDLVLVWWPADAVAATLPADWSLRHDDVSRELRWRGTAVQRVRYGDARQVLLEHLILGYRMQVDSRPAPAAPSVP